MVQIHFREATVPVIAIARKAPAHGRVTTRYLPGQPSLAV
jgi:hypothetical protein